MPIFPKFVIFQERLQVLLVYGIYLWYLVSFIQDIKIIVITTMSVNTTFYGKRVETVQAQLEAAYL